MSGDPRAPASDDGRDKSASDGAPPLPFKRWSQLYLMVLGVLLLVIATLAALTWMYGR